MSAVLVSKPPSIAVDTGAVPDKPARSKRLAAKVNVPKDVMRTSKMIDGVVWDGKDPKKYADGFKVNASSSA